MRRLASTLLFIFVAFSFASASAAEYYVSKDTGKNKNDGSKASPFKNLQKAIDVAQDGDTIYVAAGNYCSPQPRHRISLRRQSTSR
ncbi:MAG TPA: DUF1565 domain-containing protein [Myxococcota bacterium]|jgi:hypothetical protein|nr:DUF1565 domain-containing protein [Myxococcota bacterium]